VLEELAIGEPAWRTPANVVVDQAEAEADAEQLR
jgi:hypothetical protein